MKRSIAVLLTGLLFGLSSAVAQIWYFNDPLSGAQEVPPNNSPATGYASGTYDQSTRTLRIMVHAHGFEGNLTMGHIHRGAMGTNGPVVFNLNNTSGDPRMWTSDNTFTLTEAQEADFLSGLWYVNLHTTVYPGGEIRGQLNPVPEPNTLLALGLGTMGLLLRRRRI